jgi:hypothetical protein
MGLIVATVAGGGDAHAAVRKMIWAPPDQEGTAADLPIYRQLHVSVVQQSINWGGVAPSKPANPRDPNDPAYQWPAAVDFLNAQARAQGMQVALMLTYTPSWANGGQSQLTTPSNPKDFADFATAAARRYPGVRLWMVWGEPDFGNKFQPLVGQTRFNGGGLNAAQAQAPRNYARILDATYGALKSVSGKNLVIGGMTTVTGDIRPVNWVRYMRLPNGKPPRMDMYGHNPFGARRPNLRNPPSGQEAVDISDLGRFSRTIKRYIAGPLRHPVRLFLSEYCIPTGPNGEFNYYTTPPLQASWINSAFGVARKLNAYGLGWIHLKDDAQLGRGDESRCGLLTTDGTRKPGFSAFAGAHG